MMTITYKRMLWMGFVFGFIGHITMSCYLQDKMGLEAYIELLQEKWVYINPMFWTAVLVVLTVGFVLLEKKAEEADKHAQTVS